jgi:hypothetical protein
MSGQGWEQPIALPFSAGDGGRDIRQPNLVAIKLIFGCHSQAAVGGKDFYKVLASTQHPGR